MEKDARHKNPIPSAILFFSVMLCLFLIIPTANAYEYSENTTFVPHYGKVIASINDGDIQSYHYSREGNVIAITDEDGAIIHEATYEPFGEIIDSSGTNIGQHTFTGKELDETSQHYFGARYYDSNIGRFTSPDSLKGDIFRPLTLNRYSFVLNNPLKYVDLDGRQDTPITQTTQIDSSALGEFKKGFDDLRYIREYYGTHLLDEIIKAVTLGALGENKDSSHVTAVIDPPIIPLNLELMYSSEDPGLLPTSFKVGIGEEKTGVYRIYLEDKGVWVNHYVSPEGTIKVPVSENMKLGFGGRIIIDNYYHNELTAIYDMRPGTWSDFNFLEGMEAAP